MDERKSRRTAMVIEFVGAAGVGKTYLRERLTGALQAKGHRVNDPGLVRMRAFMPGSMLDVAKAAYLVFLVRPVLLATYFRSVRKLAGYILQARINERMTGIVMFDEGLFQRIRGLSRRSPGRTMKDIAEVIFSRIDPPDVVVVVEAPAAAVHSRRSERARPGDAFTHESIESDVRLVEDSIRAAEHIQRTFAPTMTVIRFDAEQSEIASAVQTIDAQMGYQASLRQGMGQ